MNKMEMMQEMSRRIEEDESLALSEWQGRFQFEKGMPTTSSLVDLNEIEIPGSPEMPEGQMTAVEMLVTSIANCYATTLHKNAYVADLSLDAVTIEVLGKFDLRPFLGLTEGNPGLIEPQLNLSVTSEADAETIQQLAEQSVRQSPVLKSLSLDIPLTVK